MKIDKTEVYGFVSAFRGARNPLNSWGRSDSELNYGGYDLQAENAEGFILGKNDLDLAQRLIKAGTEHSKFLRFIIVWADWELPLYVWKEADTYKFIEKNSCSTMHKITSRELNASDFEWDEVNMWQEMCLENLNDLIKEYKEEENKLCKEDLFRMIVQDLPSSYLQKRTIATNYAELRNIYKQRENHKLKEWHEICKWIRSLPYSAELITFGLEGE